MHERNTILADIEAARAELTVGDLSSAQREALHKAITKTVHAGHAVNELEIVSSTYAGYVYVRCLAGTTAASSGFHACIGPRGGVEYL